MHLRFVEIFCDVAQRRSFSKGAKAHNVSQSAASQAVSLLEKRLGTKLIDRSKRPLDLTPAGKVYLEGCRELLERFRAIEDRVQAIQDKVAGPVRAAAIYSVGLMQMELFVQRFETLYPDAVIRLEYLHPDRVYQQVLDDKADIGLVSYPRHGGEIVSIDWQKQPMVLVVPPAHRLAGRRSIPICELDGEDYVGFTHELTIRRQVDRQLKRSRVAVQVVHEFDNIETIKRAIEIGSGVALLPQPTVRREIASGTLAAIEISDVDLFRPLGIVHKRHKQLTTAVQKFIELLQQEDSLPASGEPAHALSRNGQKPNGRPLVGPPKGELSSARRRRKVNRA
ncbi:MAG TPA: LysR family transcriptional regulator [Planctomycetaceae bacterium]|nr:LysR family transcriptional regulator [Planctomycetaceae bacterium]